MTTVYNWFGGRTTFFAFVLLCAGIALAFADKLNTNFVALAGALQAFLTARAVADDHYNGGKP